MGKKTAKVRELKNILKKITADSQILKIIKNLRICG
jgi:hypothetical protein